MNKPDDPITRAFIGHAMKAHSAIGPGMDEELYHQELVRRLTAAGIEHLSKPRRDLVYRGIVADTFEPDLVVADHFIPELKCLRGKFAPSHLVSLFCYCKFWRLRLGYLVDFGKQSLIWERYVYSSKIAPWPEVSLPSFVAEPGLAQDILRCVSECLTEVGLGYRETTWNGLVAAALQSGGLDVHRNPNAQVLHFGSMGMPCIMVAKTCAILVTALCEKITAADRAVLQTRLRWLNLDWGIILHFGKSTVDVRFASRPKTKAELPADSGTPTDE